MNVNDKIMSKKREYTYRQIVIVINRSSNNKRYIFLRKISNISDWIYKDLNFLSLFHSGNEQTLIKYNY